MTEGGYYYSAYNIVTSEHGWDLSRCADPFFVEGAQTTDEVPLNNLVGPGGRDRRFRGVSRQQGSRFTVNQLVVG